MNQHAFDLFSYPQQAGWKARETSRAAAEKVDAATLRAKVLREIERQRYMTADECAQAVLPHLPPDRAALSIRPRITELSKLGKLMDSGFRRPNASGRSAIVWKTVP